MALAHRCHQERLPSPSTNVVEFVLQPETLPNQPVTLIKQTSSLFFYGALDLGDLGGQCSNVGFSLLAVVRPPDVAG